MNATEYDSCTVCNKSFNIITLKRKQCAFCFKNVCKKCSTEKLHEENIKKRICDPCFQLKIQEKLFAFPDYGISQLTLERDSKKQLNFNLQQEIISSKQKLDSLRKEKLELEESFSANKRESQEKTHMIIDQIDFLHESIESFNNMMPKIKEKIKRIKLEVDLKNEGLFMINEESRVLDDKIAEVHGLKRENKKQNKFIRQLLEDNSLFSKIDEEAFGKKTLMKHRKTKESFDNLSYKNVLAKIKINELEGIKREKMLKLQEIKEKYANGIPL